jgi:hypothetical protein
LEQRPGSKPLSPSAQRPPRKQTTPTPGPRERYVWDVLLVGDNPRPIGAVAAENEQEAIEIAAKEFNRPPSQLIVTRWR